MSLQIIAFYMFAAVMIGSAAVVITARNPVHSVLFLILAFFNAAGLFVLVGAEFVAMILVIVYVGAVAVLFLFVVMMLDIHFTAVRQGMKKYLPVGLLVAGILLVQMLVAVGAMVIPTPDQIALPIPDAHQVTNTHAIGLVLYTHYAYAFQMAGLVLLVAMIGAIVLTLRSRPGVRRQKVENQLARQAKDVLEIRQVKTGEGV